MAPPQSKANHLMHKNRLQEYTQKSALPLPVYQTINEGYPHAPKFRSTVLVDGEKYTSVDTFSQRKEAEQEVAKCALECIMNRVKDEVFPLIHQETLFCKSILHEFAVKMNLKIPKYTTRLAEGPRLVYASTLVFDGKTYIGEVAGSKKVAEQLAARAAIQSLLGSQSGTVLGQIIKVKGRLNSSLQIANDTTFSPITVKQEGSSQQLTNILHSDDGSISEGTIADSSYVGKRRLECSNCEQKKIRCHDQYN